MAPDPDMVGFQNRRKWRWLHQSAAALGLLVLLLVSGGLGAAQATVIGGAGGINGGAPDAAGFTLLFPPFDVSQPPSTVGADNLQTERLFAFDENQNVVAEEEIVLEIGQNVPAGTVVASHYVVFDPLWSATVEGYVEFDAPILGVATSAWSLAETDGYQNVGVRYWGARLRGLEDKDHVEIDPENPYRLNVRLVASAPGDSVRVFTAFSPSVRRGVTGSVALAPHDDKTENRAAKKPHGGG